jgi:hypothetical protein
MSETKYLTKMNSNDARLLQCLAQISGSTVEDELARRVQEAIHMELIHLSLDVLTVPYKCDGKKLREIGKKYPKLIELINEFKERRKKDPEFLIQKDIENLEHSWIDGLKEFRRFKKEEEEKKNPMFTVSVPDPSEQIEAINDFFNQMMKV